MFIFPVPVTFVDYYRADYGPEFEFYFVFLREGLAGVGQAVSCVFLSDRVSLCYKIESLVVNTNYKYPCFSSHTV